MAGSSRRWGRVFVCLLASAMFVVLLAAPALAWNLTCGAGEMCNWKNSNFVVPKAALAVSDNTYVGNNYPNTTDSINDSVSSIRNNFSSKDVVWFFDSNYSGTSFCLNPNWESGQLNSHQDEYSSHIVAVGSTC